MTPEEKAKELISKFYVDSYMYAAAGMPCDWRTRQARKYAMKCVDEMLEFEQRIIEQLDEITQNAGKQFKTESKFWNEVKQILLHL